MNIASVRIPPKLRLLTLVLAVVVLVAGVMAIVDSSLGGPRRPVDALFVYPGDIDLLSGDQWEEKPSLLAGEQVVRRWMNVRTRAYFEQSVIVHSRGFAALYGYFAEDPRINDREDLGKGSVRDARLEVSVAADQSGIYCRQAEQHSREEPCSRWIYWSRYGIYTIEIDYREPGLDSTRFSQIIRRVDMKVSSVLNG